MGLKAQAPDVHRIEELYRAIFRIIEKFDSGDYALNEYINSLPKWMGFNIVLLHLYKFVFG